VDIGGRRVLVTGASRGIGAALVRAFADAGARVALVARSHDAIEKLAADVGGDAYPVDLCDARALSGLFDRIERDGDVDVLVNNAGVDDAGHFVEMDAARIEALVRLNLVVPMELTRQAIVRMRPRGRGHIVNVSSVAASVPFPGLTAYGASKAGLSRFTAGLQRDLRGTGIGTTLVEPGAVRTEMVEHTRTFAPSRRAWDRVERLRLSVDVDADRLAVAVVRAVQRGRPGVQRPRRVAPFPLIAHAPWRVLDALLVGVDRETDEPGGPR
jgi:short-subunit dehydrogenase